MKDKKVTNEEMRDVKGGFNPVFSAIEPHDVDPYPGVWLTYEECGPQFTIERCMII